MSVTDDFDLRDLLDLFPEDAEMWQDRALCAQVDGDLFFPEKGVPGHEAKQVCQRCDVRAECLEYALEHQVPFGIWGGLSTKERRKLAGRSARSPRTSPETIAAIDERLLAGERPAGIVEELGVTRQAVHRRRWLLGIPKTPQIKEAAA